MELHEILADRINKVNNTIAEALKRAGRKDTVTVIGASKTMNRDVIQAIDQNHLLDILGENRVQELLDKYDINNWVKWHFIGTLQTNKVRQIIDKVNLIHSLDRDELAIEINKRSAIIGHKTHCLVQINMGEEPNKSGYKPNEINDAIERLLKYDNIVLEGIMAVMPIATESELKKLYSKLSDIYTNAKACYGMNILSAGMTNDYELAVEYAGSNMVRVGRAIFGERYIKNEKIKTE